MTTREECLRMRLEWLREMCEPPLTQVVECMLELTELMENKGKIGFKNEKDS